MFNLGMGEITVILLLALIFLGPKKLPELASGLGKLIREIRKTTNDVKNEIQLDDAIRKPLEELREAVTLHPEELKRRDRIRKDLAAMQRELAEAEAEAAKEAAKDGTKDGTKNGANEGTNATKPDALDHGPSGPAPVIAAAGETGDDSAKTPPPSAPALIGTAPTGLAAHPLIPGAAPVGTVARDPSGPLPPVAHRPPPIPPQAAVVAPPTVFTKTTGLMSAAAPAAGDRRLPSSSSDFARKLREGSRETAKAMPTVPPPIAPVSAADRANTTQILSESDLAAVTVTPPPPPPAAARTTGRISTLPPPPPHLPGATPARASEEKAADKLADKPTDSPPAKKDEPAT